MVNRDRHDITMSILDQAKSGKRKTELMRSVSLSFAQANRYLRFLVAKGLLETDENRSYKTTQRGIDVLKRCTDCFLCHWHPQPKHKFGKRA